MGKVDLIPAPYYIPSNLLQKGAKFSDGRLQWKILGDLKMGFFDPEDI